MLLGDEPREMAGSHFIVPVFQRAKIIASTLQEQFITAFAIYPNDGLC